MKKIISVFLALIIAFTSTTVNISAYENETSKSSTDNIEISTNDDMKLISHKKRIVAGEIQTITEISTEEGILETTVSGNLVTVRNEKGDVVFSTIIMSKNQSDVVSINTELMVFNNDEGISIAASGLAESYNVFGKWNETTTYVVLIGEAIPTLAALTASIYSAITTACPFMKLLSVQSCVSLFHKFLTEYCEINVAALISYNTYCNILVKEKVTGKVKGKNYTGAVNTSWLDSPWVYGVYPEACRYLTEIY